MPAKHRANKGGEGVPLAIAAYEQGWLGAGQGLCVLASEALRRGSRLIFLTPNPLPSEGRGSNAAPR